MSIPAMRSLCFSVSPMKPQTSARGLNARMRSQSDFASDRSCRWNSADPSVGLISRTPSHLAKKGQSTGPDRELITSIAVVAVAGMSPDTDMRLCTLSGMDGPFSLTF